MSITTTTTTAMQIDLGAGMGARKVREPTGIASFTAVPIIDLAPLSSPSPSPSALAALASQIYDACTRVGFFYIANHGIPAPAVAAIRREAARYFHAQTLPQKLAMNRDRSAFHLGYGPFEAEPKGAAMRAHRFESVLFGREVAFDPEYRATVDPKHDAENQWPAEDALPGFKDAVGDYFGAMLALSRKLTRVFALALNLDAAFFDDMLDRPGALLALNYYAPQPPQTPGVPSSIMPHTDHELFTILLQDDGIPALEVVNGSGTWVPAAPIRDTFVVNIGDALAIWTNNVFLSTLHRATNASGAARYSIPFFFGPNYDAVMETLPSCVTDERPRRYKAVTQEEHYLAKMGSSYGVGTVVAA